MNPTILIVDDEPFIRSSLLRLLSMEGYLLLTAGNAEQALYCCRTHPVDVVISDERMPGLTGVQLMSLLCTQHPEVVRIMLTGRPFEHSARDAVTRARVFRYLVKPWDDQELLEVIREGIRHRREGSLDTARVRYDGANPVNPSGPEGVSDESPKIIKKGTLDGHPKN